MDYISGKTSNALFDLPDLVMPAQHFGNQKTSGGYTKTQPREWTSGEVGWLLGKKEEGYSNPELAKACGSSEVSIQVKLKRLTKVADNYNAKNRQNKYAMNEAFYQAVQPKTMLDLYSGNSYWKNTAVNVVTNDKDKRFETDFHLDALQLLCKLYVENKKFDVIDLDPYGSAYECFDLAIKLSTKGIIVSFGEWGHKRWKRTDFVSPRYQINALGDFAEGQLFIEEIQRIAACNKKTAQPIFSTKYGNFFRVYFQLSPKKITEQWEQK